MSLNTPIPKVSTGCDTKKRKHRSDIITHTNLKSCTRNKMFSNGLYIGSNLH